ncbi:MAG: hypothetical protein B0W54_12680 [Cellvibrio sp. 79]|nr:MAG: hypothetical protein B0W54_12680 [Cellvibrio sp. 79]
MKANTAIYVIPELHTLPANSFDVAPEFKPELTVIDYKSRRSVRYARVYRVCYLDRCSIDPSITSFIERNKVNVLSLCAKRVVLMKLFVKGLLEGHPSIPDFSRIEMALDWIDEQKRSAELHTLEGARKLYRDYTDYLRHRLRLSKVGSAAQAIAHGAAQKRQSSMAYICGLACEHDPSVVRNWAIRIPQKNNGPNELPAPVTTADEHALAHALHLRFFDAFSKAVLNGAAPPVVVELADLGFEDLIYYNLHANNSGGWPKSNKRADNDWKPYFYRRDGVFQGEYKEFRALLQERDISPMPHSQFVTLRENNLRFSPSELRILANHATRHFGYLLLGEAGNNASHLASINCQHDRLDKALGLASTRAIKGRAGYEKQYQFVDTRFAQTTWRQYVRLRHWMTRQLESPPELGLFILPRKSTGDPHSVLSITSLPQLPLWPANAPSLATRPARKHKSVNLLEGSGGNTALVAGMQFARPQTISRHYAFKSLEDAMKVLNQYFAAQARAAEIRQMGIEVVRIIEGGETTHSGACDSKVDDPRLIPGLEAIDIEPRCGAPVTCIFCVHFALHANTEDILRLLTMKVWIEVQSRLKSIHIDNHFRKFLPYANRIEQITEELFKMNGVVSELVTEAFTRFERGERDPYWTAKINALLEVEGI